MLALSAPELAQIASGVAGVVWLVELDFVSTTYRFSTMNVPLDVGGNTYTPLGSYAAVGELNESQDTDTQTLTLSLDVVNQGMLAAAMGNVESYRGRQARVLLLLIDAQYRPVGSGRLRFAGEMEPVKVQRESPGADGGAVIGRIELPISRTGLSRARNAVGLRLTDEQQRNTYINDKGLEYVRALIERPTTWLSKRFQEQ
ncbi:MAG: hypothetical protein O9341_10940 [Paucibacter sp.]|nr:hypothetical protein [Roseateles sp.]